MRRAATEAIGHRHAPTCAPRAGDAEYFDPTMHAAPLRRIAEETGGRFYTPATVAGLAEDVRYAGRGVTVGRGARALEHADHPASR